MPSPFREPATGACFFAGPQTQAAELKIAYATEQSMEAAAVVGPSGVGKTTLLRRAVTRASAAGHAVVDVYYPCLSADEFLSFVESELSAETGPAPGESRLHGIANQARRLAESGRSLLIAVDDAHLLPSAVLETLQLLLNLRDRVGVSMTVLLAGQPSLLAGLSKVPAFAERVNVVATLVPFDRPQTAAYVGHRLAAAAVDVGKFDDAAIRRVQEITLGVPRSINRLCEMALLIAEADGRSSVGAADIAAAALECPAIVREAA